MPKNLPLNDYNIVTQIISELENTEERDRKTNSFDSWQVYSGNQKPYVEDELQAKRPKSWQAYTLSDVSIAKMVTDKIAKSYQMQPKRELDTEIKMERLAEVYKQGDAKNQLPFMDKIVNLHKYGLMWVNYREDEERYQFMALQPHEFSCVFDKDTGELIGVILNYGNRDITANAQSGDGVDGLLAESQADSSANTTVYAMWSRDDFVVLKVEEDRIQTAGGEQIKKSITYVDIPDNPNNENRLGMIPFVFVGKEMAIDYPTPSNLAHQSVTWNVINSELLTSGVIQGTGIMTVSYPEKYEGKFKNMTTGLTTAVKLPQSSNPDDARTEVSFESPNADLSGQRENALTYLRQILSEHGITTSQGVSGNAESFSSALEKMISEAPVQQQIEANQMRYVDMEKRMFEIIRAWENLLGANPFSEEDELNITFQKPKLMISDSEVLANIEKMLSLGLIEEHEKFMIIDPNMSDTEAREKLERINQAKQDKMQTFMGGMNANRTGPSEQENQSEFGESESESEE